MMRIPRIPAAWAGALLACALVGLPSSAAPTAPSREMPVATVNGEPIPLGRLLPQDGVGRTDQDPAQILDRMIRVELVVQEGYRMGLENTLEVRDQMGIFERDTLRDGVFGTVVQSVKVDPKEVDAMATAMTTEVRMRSVLFPKKADAERFVTRVSAGQDFENAAKAVVDSGTGQLDPGEAFIQSSELLPEVQVAVSPLAPGGLSNIYAIGDKFAVTRLVDRRAVPDPEAKTKAEAELLRRAQAEAIGAYVGALRKKSAKVDEALLSSLDFDAEKPGFDAFLKDDRPLVTIAGDEPIRVSDLADAVRKRLFHGADRAAEKGRLNRKKTEVLEDLITKRVVLKEARAKGLDKKPEYVALRDVVERELVFGAFVAKVIEPEVKISDAEIRSYYDAHRDELKGPDMARLDALALATRKDAEDAMAKLRAGADLSWLRVNAPGRIDTKGREDLLQFPQTPVMLSELPDDLRDALSKAQSGDTRLYEPKGGTSYVVLVREMLPGQTIPLDTVESRIRGRLAGQRRQKLFDEYAEKLRAASDVKILVEPEKLGELIGAPKNR